MTVPIADQVAEVKREIGQRERVFPRWVAEGRLKPHLADRRLEAMRDVLGTLERVQAEGRLI
jgi:hypothetical protein